MYKLVIGKKLE